MGKPPSSLANRSPLPFLDRPLSWVRSCCCHVLSLPPSLLWFIRLSRVISKHDRHQHQQCLVSTGVLGWNDLLAAGWCRTKSREQDGKVSHFHLYFPFFLSSSKHPGRRLPRDPTSNRLMLNGGLYRESQVEYLGETIVLVYFYSDSKNKLREIIFTSQFSWLCLPWVLYR